MKSIPVEGGEETQHLNEDEREQLDSQIGEKGEIGEDKGEGED
jgi:hypothetical protein